MSGFARTLSALGLISACLGAAAPAADRGDVWRLSGRVVAHDGRAFDYSAAFFRYPSVREPAIDPASVSIVDEDRRELFQSRRTDREALGLAAASSGSLSERVGDWSLAQRRETPPAFALRVRVPGAVLALDGIARKPVVRFDVDGASELEYTAIASTGTLTIRSERVAVSGKSWLDHEYTPNRDATVTERAARYHVQLDDGREILVAAGGAGAADRTAVMIERDGSFERLGPDDYQFGVDGGTVWRSTHTNALYPDLWALHVNGKTQFLSLEPVMIDQESIARGEGAPYWDGAVDVYDVTPTSEGRRLGSGYVILTGYAKGGTHP